jgi:hypothetical protein
MNSMLVRCSAGAALVTVAVAVQASAGVRTWRCAPPPNGAVSQIPSGPVAEWAKVICSEHGYAIVPNNSYMWSLYGGLAPVIFPAERADASNAAQRDTPYFKAIRVQVLQPPERDRIAQAAALDDQAPSPMPIVYRLQAVSNKGTETVIYFLQFPNRIEGATPCAAPMDCKRIGELLPFFIRREKAPS